jgi:Ca2+-binding EF-hand superfamily protein
VKGDKESKLKCKHQKKNNQIIDLIFILVAFKIYDIDKDGFISNGKCI